MGSDPKARRGLRAAVTAILSVATATSVALIGLSASTAGATPPTSLQRAQRGAQWLANQITHNGGVLVNFGKPDPVDTAYAVIGMRAAGVGKGASNKAVAYLKTKIAAQVQSGGHDSPGALAEYILAAVSNGQDPRHFGGNAARNDLVGRLLATERTSGPDSGLFGVQSPAFDGAFRQGLSLSALAAVHFAATDPRVTAGIAWLANQQCTNGLWQAYRASTTAACPASNPKTFTGPDTNSTAFAVEGLAAWGSFPRQATVLDSLRAAQSADAGFPFVAAKGQKSDPNSTALVIQALVAEHSAPTAAQWKKGAHTPFSALAAYQLGCTSSGFGAFVFPGSPTANVFATVQSVPAMAGQALPVGSSAASVTVSLKQC